MPTLSEIHVYPVKGCAGVALPEVSLDARGPVGDRRFMVVDEHGMFITQRGMPKLALITALVVGPTLSLRAAGMPELLLPIHETSSARIEAQVWRSKVNAASMGVHADRWLSDFLQVPARLVHMDALALRTASTEHAPANTQVGFADGYPILLISQSALDQLNKKLAQPVPMNRFRPNLVVTGTEPHAEDTWKRIRIGDVVLDVVKPCDRCTVTTIDQSTALASKEPLKTLAGYRARDNKIYFGQNVVHRGLGTLRVGAEVEVVESQPSRALPG